MFNSPIDAAHTAPGRVRFNGANGIASDLFQRIAWITLVKEITTHLKLAALTDREPVEIQKLRRFLEIAAPKTGGVYAIVYRLIPFNYHNTFPFPEWI